MPVELQDNELQAVADAVEYFLWMRGKAKRQSHLVKVVHARLTLVSDRLRLALDAQVREAVQKVASRLAKPEGKETIE